MFKKLKLNINENLKDKIKFLFIMLMLTIFVCLPYISNGTIFAHDLAYHLSRIINTSNEITNGSFPVFIHSDLLNGLGYGNSLFYPELFLFPAIILVKLGFGVLLSYKALILLITFSTFLTSYYSAKIISKDTKVPWITSILYTTALYRIVDIFVRGALGEILAMIFLPLMIAGLYDLVWGENKRWYLISFALFGILNSHLLSTLMGVILLVILCIVNATKIIKDKKKIKNIILAAVISILLASSFLFTYIEQKVSDTLSVDVHRNSGESLLQNATTITDALNNDFVSDGIFFTKAIGILLLIFPIGMFMIENKKDRKEYKFYMQLYIIGMIVWLMSTDLFKWENTTMFSILQFPYRLNVISTLLLSFVAGYSIMNIFENKDITFKVLIFVILIMVSSQISDVNTNPNSITYDLLMSGNLIGNGEYKPVGFSEEDLDVYNVYEFESKIPFERTGSKITFNYEENENEFKVHVPFTYYKGYQAYSIDEEGNKQYLKVEKNDLNAHLLISSNENIKGKVVVEYKMTMWQAIGYITTIMTIVIFINYIIYNKKIRKAGNA